MISKKPDFLWPTNINCVFTKGFWEGLKRGQFLTRRCCRCSEVFFPPRSHCPHCLGSDLEWVELSGRGVLHSWTEVYIAGPEFNTPFLMGLVDLSEGVGRIASMIVGAKVHQLRIGMPVRIIYTDVHKDLTLYRVTIDQ